MCDDFEMYYIDIEMVKNVELCFMIIVFILLFEYMFLLKYVLFLSIFFFREILVVFFGKYWCLC